MQQMRLGRSGPVVSRLAIGTWQLGGDWGPTDTATALDAIRRAVDEGVNLFDTAQSYGFGQSEQLLSAALRGVPRDQIVLATKGGLRRAGDGPIRDASARSIRDSVDASLRALSTDYLDLYQLQWSDPATPVGETAEELARLMTLGKVRHVGVSNFDMEQMSAFESILPVEAVQSPYNLLQRDIERHILPYTGARDIGVLVCGPLAHGLLSGTLSSDTRFARDDWRCESPMFRGERYARNLSVVAGLGSMATQLGITLPQLAISWTLSHPGVQVAIVGTRNRAHIDEAVEASAIDLDDDVLQQVDDLVAKAVPVASPSPDGI